jgi:ABC-type polysaccharide/polyol phosphate export permease
VAKDLSTAGGYSRERSPGAKVSPPMIQRGSMIRSMRELFMYRELLYVLTWRDIKVKYKQSVMGIMWAIFMPALVISAGVLVKFAFARLSGGPLGLSQVATVSVKAIPWSFFIASLRFGTNSLTANSNLVTKIYFPNEVFPISAVLSQLFDFTIASFVLIVILVCAQIGVSIYLLWVPILLSLLILLAVASVLLLSTANLFFRDVKYIVEVIVTFAIFFTPVFYEADFMGTAWKPMILLNPVAPILEGFNACIVLRQMPEMVWIAYSTIIAITLFLLSFILFKKMEPAFAENI